MAGKPKITIEYFPHLLKDSTTIKALELMYGNNGYAVWFKLLEVLGSNANNGYQYVAKTKESCEYLLNKFGIDGKLMGAILNTLCELNAIDKNKWKQERTLFVPNLINNIQKIKKTVSVSTGLIEHNPIKSNKKLYLDYIYLTDDEYNKLIDKFGHKVANEWISKANDWIGVNPKAKSREEKASHYHTILCWARRDPSSQISNTNPNKNTKYRDLSNYNLE